MNPKENVDKIKLLQYLLEKSPVRGLEVRDNQVFKNNSLLTPWDISNELLPLLEKDKKEFLESLYLKSLDLGIEKIEWNTIPYAFNQQKISNS